MRKIALLVIPHDAEVAEVEEILDILSQKQFECDYLRDWKRFMQADPQSQQFDVLWAIVIVFESHTKFDVKRIRQLRGKE